MITKSFMSQEICRQQGAGPAHSSFQSGSGQWHLRACVAFLTQIRGCGGRTLQVPQGVGPRWTKRPKLKLASPIEEVLSLTGDKDMICPAQDRQAFIHPQDFGGHALVSFRLRQVSPFGEAGEQRPTLLTHHSPTVFEPSQPGRRATCFLPDRPLENHPYHPGKFPLLCLPFHPQREAISSRPCLVPTCGLRRVTGRKDFCRFAPKRVSHGQQNAYRRVSPGRNKGGRPSR